MSSAPLLTSPIAVRTAVSEECNENESAPLLPQAFNYLSQPDTGHEHPVPSRSQAPTVNLLDFSSSSPCQSLDLPSNSPSPAPSRGPFDESSDDFVPVLQGKFKGTLRIVQLMLFAAAMNIGLVTPIKYFYIVSTGGSLFMVGIANAALGIGCLLSLLINWKMPPLKFRVAFLIGLSCGNVGLLMFVLAVDSITIVVSRLIFGIFYGMSISLCTAAIAFITHEKERTSVMLSSQVIMSLGLIAGAGLAAACSQLPISSHYFKFDRFTGPTWFNFVCTFAAFMLMTLAWEEPPNPRSPERNDNSVSSSTSLDTTSALVEVDEKDEDPRTSSFAVSPSVLSTAATVTAVSSQEDDLTNTHQATNFSIPVIMVGLSMFLNRFLLSALEVYMTAATSEDYGWTEWQNSVVFLVLNSLSCFLNVGGGKISPRYIDEVSLLAFLYFVGFVSLLFLHGLTSRPSIAVYITGVTLYFSVSVVISLALNKSILTKVVKNSPNTLFLIGLASVFADFGRLVGPLWVVFACDNFSDIWGQLDLCAAPRSAVYGLMVVAGSAMLLIGLGRRALMRFCRIEYKTVSQSLKDLSQLVPDLLDWCGTCFCWRERDLIALPD